MQHGTCFGSCMNYQQESHLPSSALALPGLTWIAAGLTAAGCTCLRTAAELKLITGRPMEARSARGMLAHLCQVLQRCRNMP